MSDNILKSKIIINNDAKPFPIGKKDDGSVIQIGESIDSNTFDSNNDNSEDNDQDDDKYDHDYDDEQVNEEFEDYSNTEVEEIDPSIISKMQQPQTDSPSKRNSNNIGSALVTEFKDTMNKGKMVAENIIHNLKKINIKKRRPKQPRVGFAGKSNPTESFSIDIGMMWLLKSIERSTIQKHVCERILKLPHRDFQFYLPQIIHVCVVYNSEPIITMLLEKCKLSIIIAAQAYFLLQATVHDNNPATVQNAKVIWRKCEMATLGILSDDLHSFSSTNNNISEESDDTLSDSNIVINEQYWFEKDSTSSSTSTSPPFSPPISPPLKSTIPNNTTTTTNSRSPNNPLLSSSPKIPINRLLSQFNDDLTSELQEHQQHNMINKSRENLQRLSFSTSELAQQLHSHGSTLSKPIDKPTLASFSKDPYSFFFDLLEYEVEVVQDENGAEQQNIHSINSSFDDGASSSSSSSLPNSPRKSQMIRTPSKMNINGDIGKDISSCKVVKKKRYNYQPFYSELLLINILSKVGDYLLSIPLVTDRAKLKDMRNAALRAVLKQLNEQLFSDNNSILLPVYPPYLVLGISYEEAVCLNSRERVPFLIVLEVKKSSDSQLYQDPNNEESKLIDISDNDDSDSELDEEINEREWTILKNNNNGNNQPPISPPRPTLDTQNSQLISTVYGERWKDKESRIWKTSDKSQVNGWSLISFIIKSGDDLRQESLAMQIITQFFRIFKRSNLPLWLRPYLVIATGFDSGLIETVPDSVSIDTLKKRDTNYTTLLDYFIRAYGDTQSRSFLKAQSNFIESLAAYSLVCYFLQIKDRHNGNILLDSSGHIIHIDYGFIMSSSPGSMNFEKAPFKLTEDFIELMGGVKSERFIYFTNLLISGFQEVRKHTQEFLMMIELLLPYTNLTCILKNGESAITEFKSRFKLELTTPEECTKFIEHLVDQSLHSWSTSSYDTYQYYTNGII